MIFWRKIVIFTRNTPTNFAPSSARRKFLNCPRPNLKSWIRPWRLSISQAFLYCETLKATCISMTRFFSLSRCRWPLDGYMYVVLCVYDNCLYKIFLIPFSIFVKKLKAVSTTRIFSRCR